MARTLPNVKDLRRLGDMLVDWRITAGLTQEVVAERAALSVQFLGRVERGQVNPSFLALRSIAHALEHDLEELARAIEGYPSAN